MCIVILFQLKNSVLCSTVEIWGLEMGLGGVSVFLCLVFFFHFFICPMFIFEDLILQGNAYKDPVLFEVFHIFIVVFRCSLFIKKKRNFLVEFSTLKVPFYIKNNVSLLKTLLNSKNWI